MSTFKERSNVQYMIELSQKQINEIARSISVLTIKTYIEQNRKKYEQFLKDEEIKVANISLSFQTYKIGGDPKNIF